MLRRSHPARHCRASILPVNSMVLAAHLSNSWWQKSRKLSLSAPFLPTCSRMSDGACSSAARTARQRPFYFPPFSLASFRARAPASYQVNFTVNSSSPSLMSKRPAPPLAVRKDIFELAVKRGQSTISKTQSSLQPASGPARAPRTKSPNPASTPVAPESTRDLANSAEASARKSQRRARNPPAPSPVGSSRSHGSG